MIDISVIIVTWNSEDDILNCVNSITADIRYLSVELIIIDNNSTDASFQLVNNINFPQLHTFRNPENLGYTKAVNQGIKQSRGKYVMLLNPDTILKENSLTALFNFLESNPDYAACAPLMINPDGTVQYSVRNFPAYGSMFAEFSLLAYIFPKTRLFGRWKAKFLDYSAEQDIEQPMAAAFMFRRILNNEVLYMDERFKMFFNDVDLCRQIYNSGFRIRLLPSSVIKHKHGASIKKDRANMIRIWNKDCAEYFEKHFGKGLLLLWLKINLKVTGFIRIIALRFS